MTLGNFKLVIGAIFLFAHTFALPAAGTPAAVSSVSLCTPNDDFVEIFSITRLY